jgi:hypothetical protein
VLVLALGTTYCNNRSIGLTSSSATAEGVAIIQPRERPVQRQTAHASCRRCFRSFPSAWRNRSAARLVGWGTTVHRRADGTRGRPAAGIGHLVASCRCSVRDQSRETPVHRTRRCLVRPACTPHVGRAPAAGARRGAAAYLFRSGVSLGGWVGCAGGPGRPGCPCVPTGCTGEASFARLPQPTSCKLAIATSSGPQADRALSSYSLAAARLQQGQRI